MVTPGLITYLEFYAGIGGWRMAMNRIVPQAICVQAYDHSTLCIDVYQHNFHDKPNHTPIENIPRLPQADIWVMSPPCQPHTRQHSNQQLDAQDPRSASFWHICQLLLQCQSPNLLPKIILLENVVGFESSSSCRHWRSVLAQQHYRIAQFILSPTQVGIPNDRPRYFAIAIQEQLISPLTSLPTSLSTPLSTSSLPTRMSTQELASHYFRLPLDSALGDDCHTHIPQLETSNNVHDSNNATLDANKEIRPLTDFLTDTSTAQETLQVPSSILQRNVAWCFDIVRPTDQRSACFTSSYGKFVRGTGSVIYLGQQQFTKLQDPKDRTFNDEWAQGLDLEGNLRYFSGMEMTRLFGFNDSFSFPPHVTTKQQWKLVGNSINVAVAAKMVELAMSMVQLQS